MYQEEQESRHLFGTDPTMGLFVALYLILLAFFIMLNAVSEHAASRASDAMESVNSTFHKGSFKDNQPTIDPTAEDIPANDIVLRDISRAFLSEMNLPGRFSSSGGNVFEVEFPAEYLFERGSMQVRPDMHPFLDQLIKAVQQSPKGRKQQVAIMFGTGAGPVDREMTRTQEVAARRAGTIARYLQERGIEKGAFATGFVSVSEANILAVFQSIPVLSAVGGN